MTPADRSDPEIPRAGVRPDAGSPRQSRRIPDPARSLDSITGGVGPTPKSPTGEQEHLS